MTTLKALGYSDERLKQLDPGTGQLRPHFIKEAVRLDISRSDRATAYPIENLQDDDLIELIFEDDIHRWLTVAEFKQEFGAASRGTQPDELVVPPRLPVGGPARGVTTVALKALRVIGFDPTAKFTGFLAEAYDKHLMPEPGLFRFSAGPQKRGNLVTAKTLSANRPILLFIHGTFSSTSGSFGKLSPENWATLRQKYGDNILGLDHYTMSQSPIQNALDLARNLPDGAQLHLVTHSRGGMVGELLCRSGIKNRPDPFDQLDLDLGHPERDRTLLEALSKELKRKEFKIERFARVACPAAGTTLASGRLDRWLEVMVNVLGKITGAAAFVPYGVITDMLLDIKKQGANPEEVPGLAAMALNSAMVKMLNRQDIVVEADLSVIAGDIERGGILSTVAALLSDLFYREQNDLVVPTRSMYGGAPREKDTQARYSLDEGPDVNHLTYFKNERSVAQLQAALALNPAELKAKGFRPLSGNPVLSSQATELAPRSYQKRSGIPQPVVFMLPGLMGSHLGIDGDRIWLDLLDLAGGKLAELDIDAAGVKAQAPIAAAYGKLIDYLSATHEVIPFPFDWRLSILDEARGFGDAVAAKLAETDQPVRILAHSMGGLVARAMFGLRPKVWEAFSRRKGSRLIMLGTPNQGSFVIPHTLLGKESILRMLALVDLKNSSEQIQKIIVRYPGLLELLPVDNDGWDFFDLKSWDRLQRAAGDGWEKPRLGDLKKARNLRGVLDHSPVDPVRMIYVAGQAAGTPIDIKIDPEERKVQFIGTDEGDGRVPWRSGGLPGVKTWYMENVKHGDLADYRPAFPALYELLDSGYTARLPTAAPAVSRAAARYYALEDRASQPEFFPSQVDLERAALGGAPPQLTEPARAIPVQVSVVHGNLSFCNCPVAVGHYEGDLLLHAEKALDRHLNGRLKARHQLGLYPGPTNTVKVILPKKKSGGAIVVGLGKAGELSARDLNDTFTRALLEYAVKAAEGEQKEAPEDPGERHASIEFATLLIGTGGDGLTIPGSVGAILNSIVRANRALSKMETPYRVRIAGVQFVELWKDRAVEAFKALEPYVDDADFLIDTQLKTIPGGQRRISYASPPGWWSRLTVRAARNNTLVFTVPGSRARVEQSQLAVQRSNIDKFIERAVNNPSWDPELASAMFELLIPNWLKNFSRDLSDLVVVVDQESARYPWELIHDRRAGYDEPMSVKVGMIRQLATFTFRDQVLDVIKDNVLVVGDPINTPKEFVPLPGAEREASMVADTLEQHRFRVTRKIGQGADAGSIMTSLLADDYRVLHLAGHGVYRYQRHDHQSGQDEDKLVTGMVLGDGVFLTAVEIEQMVQVPELVFVNCCYLGVLGSPEDNEAGSSDVETYPRHAFAASLAIQLINMGVKAVVVAGWAVDDAAALTFANIFYEEMLGGKAFGEAVKKARAETYTSHGDRTNTWGAYQCYGDPAYKLVKTVTLTQNDQKSRFVDPEDAIVEINNLIESARTTAMHQPSKLRHTLNEIYDNIHDTQAEWLKRADLQEALGWACGELFLFKLAVKHFEIALSIDAASMSIKAIEQLANFRARAAVGKYGAPRTSDAAADIRKSIDQLEKMNIAFFPTSERLSLIGSAYKWLAQISMGPARDEALDKMISSYTEAWQETRKRAPEDDADPYPLTNALVAQLVRYWLGDVAQRDSGLRNQLDLALTRAEDRRKKYPYDFWAAIGLADAELARHLLDENLKDHQADLLEQYHEAWQKHGSSRQLRSVIEQLEFLMAVFSIEEPETPHDSAERGAKRREFYDALKFIWSNLAPALEQ